MKNIFRLASLFAFSFFMSAAMTGCSSDPVVEEEQEGSGSTDTPGEEGEDDEELVYMTIEANSPGTKQGNNGSRTQIDKNDHVLWEKGDAISVFYKPTNENKWSNASFVTKDEGGTAIFGGMATSDNKKFYAIYPYKVTAQNDDVKGISSYFDTRQYVPPTGGFDPTACHSYATLEHKQSDPNGQYYSGQFKMLVSMVGLKFDLSDLKSELKEIRVSIKESTAEGTPHHHLAGDYTIDATDPDAPKMVLGDAISHYLYVSTVGKTGFMSGAEYLIATPVIPDPVKLVFTFMLEDGRIWTATSKEMQLERACINPMKQIAFEDNLFVEAPNKEIANEEDFVNWYKDETNEYKVVKLTQDLDLENYTDLVTRPYSGLFDGNGHTIKNMTVSPSKDGYCAFLGNVNGGEIKDLTLVGFKTNNSAKCVGTIAGYIQNETRITNCKVQGAILNSGNYVGGLVGRAYRSTIFGCELNDVTISGVNCIGGFIGRADDGNTLAAVYMFGVVKDEMGDIGGMIGSFKGDGNKVISCYSMATIDADEDATPGAISGSGLQGNTINHSYYAGSTEINGKISKEELVVKKQEMNAAIAKSGYEYVDNTDSATKDALPLVLKENASSEE